MKEFLQLVLSSLSFGSVYAITALGMVIVFKASGVVNFAYGSYGTLIAMVFATVYARLGGVLAWIICIAAALVAGSGSERLLLRRAERSRWDVPLVVTLGLFLGLEGLMGMIWGYYPRHIPQAAGAHVYKFGGYTTTSNELLLIGAAVGITVLVGLVYEKTFLGAGMRAVAADRDTAALMGIPSRRFIAGAWAVGIAITGVGAVLAAPMLGLTPTMLDNVVLFAFAGSVIGGFGSLLGCLAGSFIVGIVSNLTAGYASADLQLTIVFGLLVAVLYVRPAGIFGKKEFVRG